MTGISGGIIRSLEPAQSNERRECSFPDFVADNNLLIVIYGLMVQDSTIVA